MLNNTTGSCHIVVVVLYLVWVKRSIKLKKCVYVRHAIDDKKISLRQKLEVLMAVKERRLVREMSEI